MAKVDELDDLVLFINTGPYAEDGYSVKVSDVTLQLIKSLIRRDAFGKKKYGTSLDRTDLTREQWLDHMTEELLDAAGYAQSAKR